MFDNVSAICYNCHIFSNIDNLRCPEIKRNKFSLFCQLYTTSLTKTLLFLHDGTNICFLLYLRTFLHYVLIIIGYKGKIILKTPIKKRLLTFF
jgi:hypothetical protein